MFLKRKPHEVFNEIINNNYEYIFLTKVQGDRSLQNISSHSLGFIEKTQFIAVVIRINPYTVLIRKS